MAYTLNQLIASFLEHWQYVKNRTPETTRNYELYLRRFQRWSKLTSPQGITSPLVTDYKKYLRLTNFDGKKLSSSTINYHLIALRNFLKYLQLHTVTVRTDKKIILATYKPDHRLTPTKLELQSLLTAPAKSIHDPQLIRLRDQALLATMVDTGLKVASVSRLDKISLRGRTIKIEGQTYPLGQSTHQLIKSYLQHRQDNNSFLFLPHDRAQSMRQKQNRPMTPRSIQRLVKKYIVLAGITRPITADSLTKIGIK